MKSTRKPVNRKKVLSHGLTCSPYHRAGFFVPPYRFNKSFFSTKCWSKQNKLIKAFFSEIKKKYILKVKKDMQIKAGGQKFLAPSSILARHGTGDQLFLNQKYSIIYFCYQRKLRLILYSLRVVGLKKRLYLKLFYRWRCVPVTQLIVPYILTNKSRKFGQF